MEASTDAALTQVTDLLFAVAIEDATAAKSRLLSDARRILADALQAESLNAELHYAMGLCWYHEPQWSDEALQAMERAFGRALELKPSHPFALLYTGHFHFDKGRYDEAIEYFLKADEAYFDRLGQHWRVLKNRELIVCCRLYTRPGEVTESEIERLCSSYERAVEEDRPVPQEIVVCLAKVAANRSGIGPIAKRVLRMATKIGFESVASIRDEVQALRLLF